MLSSFQEYYTWLHGKWPAGTVEQAPRVNDDGTCDVPGVFIVGDLTGIPLLKFSADSGAKAVQSILEEPGFEPSQDSEIPDIAIIGAGVSGISAAIEASKSNLSSQVFESAESFSTIRNFPKGKPIYTYPTEMDPAGDMHFEAEVKEGLLEELEAQKSENNIEITSRSIEKISHSGDHLTLHSGQGESKARRVIIAIGKTGNFRKLEIPGENLDKVSNRLIDPAKFSDKNLLIVGGGDSALEAAISLVEEGAHVDLAYRGEEFNRPKPDNIAKILSLSESGEITLQFETDPVEILENEVKLSNSKDGSGSSLKNDHVFTLIGREAPLDFFRKSGIRVTGDRSPRWWLGLIAFFSLLLFLYHFKGYQSFFGIPGTSLTSTFSARGWFPYNLPVAGPENSLLRTTLATARNDPGFLFSCLYTAIILIFGFRRIRRRKTPYVKLQTATLAAFQVIPLFLLPYILFPWMGANGAFTNGGFGAWFGTTFLSDGPGTEPDQYWRAFGFILAWPLFIYNIFTEAPLWGWLVLGFIQTFVIIPLIVWRWGKGAYCGWICSCGALAETLGDSHRRKMPHGPRWNKLNMLGQGILALAFVILILRIIGWIFPATGINSIAMGIAEKWSPFSYKYLIDLWLAGAIGYGLYFHFSGRVWCRFACPLAALMHIYARFTRFRIFAEKEKCISCNVCTTVCHQGIDVMSFANKGKPMEDPQCVRCSACVSSCPTDVLTFGRLDKNSQPVFDTLPASLVRLAERRKAE